MVAAKLETMKQGRPNKDANLQVYRSDAAARLHVSTRSVADAAKVRSTGNPRLVDRVEAGKIAVSVAAQDRSV